MLFNSYTFILFFAVVLGLHNLPLPWRVKKFNLLWASYLFYAAWNPPFTTLLAISTVADWFVGKWLHRAEKPIHRRLLLATSLVINLGLLGFFKYSGFLLDNFTALLKGLGVGYQAPALSVVLPVGISFYTFQTLSYTLDIYFRKMRPRDSFLDYAMYVAFFPQLVAGPIVRASDFLPQCREPRRATSDQLGWGLSLMVLGLFQKIVIADGIMAPIVESVYDGAQLPSFRAAWIGTLAFSTQIFCDFAGYSTCAIGVATCLGFRLPDNFRFPYAAIGFSDFWRRWHISLSTWLRDYLYIPLGGNRKGKARTYLNVMVTMLLGGLWHGASWTFVFWGGLHGVFLAVERGAKRLAGEAGAWRATPGRVALALLTYLLVCVAWVFFRAKSLPRAGVIVGAMFGWISGSVHGAVGEWNLVLVLGLTALVLLTHWCMREKSLEDRVARMSWWLKAAFLAAMLVGICTMPGEDRAFIYFQF